MSADKPKLIEGGRSVDNRGYVSFVNEFDPSNAKRFYIVENFVAGYARAWHAHQKEKKWVLATSGSALVCCVEVDDWENPSKELPVERYVLDAGKPAVLEVPAGYANGAMSLVEGTKIMYFSDATLDQSRGDDFRFPARYWDPWQIEER